jgi:hypothetical protein
MSSPSQRDSLLEFFSNEGNAGILANVLNRTSVVSLRLLDFFCVSYSKEYDVSYDVDGRMFEPHLSYKSQLQLHSKKHFDPFRRGGAEYGIIVNGIDTTIGQLCFFKWCIDNRVIEYISEHHDVISSAMKSCSAPKNNRESRRRRVMISKHSDLPLTHVIMMFD